MPPELGKQNANAKSNLGAKGLEKDSGMKKSSSELVFKECDDLEEELAALKVAYEQYFLGNERLAPARAHDDFKKRIMKLKTSMVRNTAAKFRMNSLHNKFLTYERMWQRTLQEIEAGTYKRDLFKAKRRTQKSSSGERRQEAHELLEEELSDDDLVEVAPIIPNEPVPVKPAKPAFIPRPVDDAPTFRPQPTATPVPAVPVVPVVPTVPTVSPVASGTPFRGTPAAVTPAVPAIPTVAPAVGTPARGTAVAPPGATPSKGTPSIPPGATPSRGTAAVPPGATPSKGTAAVPPGATPSKGTPVVPPGGTPSRGTPTVGTPGRGVPAFGSPSQGTSGIAAALESLTDEPLTRAPSASTPARPAAPAAARPGTPATGPKPGAPAASRPATPAAAPKPAAASGAGGLSDDKLKAVYDAYVTAKRRNQEDVTKMSYESVAANLRKQVPELLKQSGAKSVEFKVVIKDGKATLKAVPK
jgi:hypothetical protein